MSDAEQIWNVIQAANAAWLGGDPQEVAPLFHDDVVMAAPDGRPFLQGKDDMVRSYVAYCEKVKTHELEVLEHMVRVFGDTAVARYRFRVRYEHGGQEHDETGAELMAFARHEGTWRAVWRMQLPAPAENE
ncbi:MAG: nuclear transport factor 2 family protein [Planctomycetota bacterium]